MYRIVSPPQQNQTDIAIYCNVRLGAYFKLFSKQVLLLLKHFKFICICAQSNRSTGNLFFWRSEIKQKAALTPRPLKQRKGVTTSKWILSRL